jgi:hypothetical protein
MKKIVTIILLSLLTLTLTGSVAVVVHEAPELAKVRIFEIGGCKVEAQPERPPALFKLLPPC